jgi:thiol-disulfide isomerase/thioredoxin
MRRAWRAALAACAAALAAGCDGGQGPGAGAGAHDPPPFRIAFTAEGLDGRPVTLADFRGRVVLVDLFGTWCPTSRRTTPALVSLHQRYRSRGLEVVALAYERTPDAAQAQALVRAFADQHSLPFVLALGPEDLKEQVPGHVRGYPTLVLVDRQGLARGCVSEFPAGYEEALAERIERLLDEPAVGTP